MHVGRKYTFFSYILWTKYEIGYLCLVALLPSILYLIFGWDWTFIPGYITGVVGTAMAFVVSFKNHAAYQRFTTAMSVYSQIQKDSFKLGHLIPQIKTTSAIRMQLLNQHFAWLTCMRYRLRKKTNWGNLSDKGNIAFMKKTYEIPESKVSLREVLSLYLTPEHIDNIEQNFDESPTYCLNLQFGSALKIKNKQHQQDFINLIYDFYDDQLKALEIKDVPYPRNFYSLTEYLINIFNIILPFSLFSQTQALIHHHFFLNVMVVMVVSVLISWIFVSLDKVGQNIIFPYEGNSNDVPITAISQRIKIKMLNYNHVVHQEKEIQPQNHILM